MIMWVLLFCICWCDSWWLISERWTGILFLGETKLDHDMLSFSFTAAFILLQCCSVLRVSVFLSYILSCVPVLLRLCLMSVEILRSVSLFFHHIEKCFWLWKNSCFLPSPFPLFSSLETQTMNIRWLDFFPQFTTALLLLLFRVSFSLWVSFWTMSITVVLSSLNIHSVISNVLISSSFIFCSCAIFTWFGYQGRDGFIECVSKCSLLLIFLEYFM